VQAHTILGKQFQEPGEHCVWLKTVIFINNLPELSPSPILIKNQCSLKSLMKRASVIIGKSISISAKLRIAVL